MAKLAMHRPLDEGDLHDDLGTHPVRPNSGQPDGFGERGFWNLERIEPRAEFHQQLHIEARTYLAGEDKIFILEITYEQRAQTDSSSLRVGEPADHKLLRRLALHLHPVRRAAMLVQRVPPLCNDAFPAFAAGPLPWFWIRQQGHALQGRSK